MADKYFKTTESTETWDGYGAIKSCEHKYIVLGPVAMRDAMNLIMQNAPAGIPVADYNDTVAVRKEIRFEGWDEDGNAEISVAYEVKSNEDNSSSDSDDQEPTMSFDCGGGTKHLTHSLKQTRKSGTKDAGGAINWNGKTSTECQIAGIDVPTAQLRESYTRYMRPGQLTTSFKRKVAALVGKVNKGKFKGWSAGEVMFLGMSYSGALKGPDKIAVTFNFSIQPNESTTINGQKISKNGFEYAWALSQTVEEKGVPKIKTEAIYVEKVCEEASFSGLGL